LNNAFRFTSEGRIVISAEIIKEKQSEGNHSHLDSVIVSVKDTGTGINPENITKAF
jgi:signal transduction histidine kinase